MFIFSSFFASPFKLIEVSQGAKITLFLHRCYNSLTMVLQICENPYSTPSTKKITVSWRNRMAFHPKIWNLQWCISLGQSTLQSNALRLGSIILNAAQHYGMLHSSRHRPPNLFANPRNPSASKCTVCDILILFHSLKVSCIDIHGGSKIKQDSIMND